MKQDIPTYMIADTQAATTADTVNETLSSLPPSTPCGVGGPTSDCAIPSPRARYGRVNGPSLYHTAKDTPFALSFFPWAGGPTSDCAIPSPRVNDGRATCPDLSNTQCVQVPGRDTARAVRPLYGTTVLHVEADSSNPSRERKRDAKASAGRAITRRTRTSAFPGAGAWDSDRQVPARTTR